MSERSLRVLFAGTPEFALASLTALVEAGVYKDPFFSDNLDKIPGEQFEQPWWFRKKSKKH